MPDRLPTVCHILHSLGVGGAEVLAARLARRLARSHRSVFICLDGLGTLGEELAAEGFTAHVVGRHKGLDPRCAWRLARLLRRERADLIHAHQYTPFSYALLSRMIGRRLPILFTEHGRHFPDFPRPKRRIVNRLLLRESDRVVGVGEAVRQALIQNEGIPAHRVEVVYNGIDAGSYAVASPARAEVRRELGIGLDDLTILQVARLDTLKDHATAIDALVPVVRHRPDIRLVLAGDGPLRGPIEERIRRLGLERQVRLLGTRRDVARLLWAADMKLLTSISEGIPLTLLEGMAAGLPVVATQVGGVGEVVANGRTGLLAPAGDAMALAHAILTLAESPVLRLEMGHHGRRRVEELFSEERMCARYGELYQEMIGETGPTRSLRALLPRGRGSAAYTLRD